MKKSPVVTIVATGIGAALFFVLGRFLTIPTPIPNMTISPQHALLAFMAFLFGPIPGALIGFIGHTLIDFSFGWGIWWSWVIASGVSGLVMGLVGQKFRLAAGKFGKKEIVSFILCVVISNLVAWLVVAPVLDILIYAEPVGKVFVQGISAAIINIVAAGVIGTLLCLAYAATKPKAGSLKEE